MNEDVYFKKILTYNFWKHSLRFKTSQELFSSHEIDLGTQFLLRTIVEAGYNFSAKAWNILDMGCGYGALGLTLKSLNKDSLVHMVDRDALAVDYSAQNAVLNGLSDTVVYGSLGYDDVQRTDFDLIVSNIPGKAGEPVISYLLREAVNYLKPDGVVAIVVVTPLEKTAENILENSPEIEIINKKARPGHTVFHYRFIGRITTSRSTLNSVESGIYQRNKMVVSYGDLNFPMQTAYSLPEFDSLDYRTEMLIQALPNKRGLQVQEVAVFNPGQGHIAVALWRLMPLDRILLVDRDLLALRYTRLNLISNQCPPERVDILHQTGIDLKHEEGVDLFAGMLREEEGQKGVTLTLQQAVNNLAAGGTILLSGSSTAITRLMVFIQAQDMLQVEAREKWRGSSLLILKRTLS